MSLTNVYIFIVVAFAFFLLFRLRKLNFTPLRAIIRNEFYMVYQPIVRVSDNKIVSIEALMRLSDDRYSSTSPESLITMAEKYGLYKKMSKCIVDKSLHDFSFLVSASSNLLLSLNVSGVDILDDSYLKHLRLTCKLYSIPLSRIKLEISERCDADIKKISLFCDRAKLLGFLISIDDFGKGYSNIHWLLDMRYDEVKIDKYLVSKLRDCDAGEYFIPIVMKLINDGVDVVFEGVETEEQMTQIKLLSSNFLVQGWFTGKPLEVEYIIYALNGNKCQL